MDAMVSTVLTSVRESANALLSSGSPESLALVFWGCGLLAVGAGVRSLIAQTPRQGHRVPAGVAYGSDDRSLTESRA